MGISLAFMSVHHLHTVPPEAEEGVRSPGAGVRDDCDPPHGCWESSAGPLEDKPVLLIVVPSLSLKGFLKKSKVILMSVGVGNY